jgi:hypothetical protein
MKKAVCLLIIQDYDIDIFSKSFIASNLVFYMLNMNVSLQAQPIPPDQVAKLLGNRVAVSPIVTVEPRRRKFHKPITLTIPLPKASQKGMINQYGGDAPTLRLLCSITGKRKLSFCLLKSCFPVTACLVLTKSATKQAKQNASPICT